ncbi:MAG: CsbD family protein [Alphaproteobacteria bacterium]|nr:CsbD family protein [Alphaproteobacteria bacterium]
MNRDIFEGNWKQLKGEIQRQWGKLTNDEIDEVEGNRMKLVGLIQERYGVAKDEAEEQLRAWEDRHAA